MYAGQSRGLASWVVGRRGWEGTKGGFGQGVGVGRGPMVGRRSMTCEVSLTYAQTVSSTWYGDYNLHTTHRTTLHTTMAECTKTTFVMRLLEHDWELKKTGERETAEVGVGGNGGGIVGVRGDPGGERARAGLVSANAGEAFRRFN